MRERLELSSTGLDLALGLLLLPEASDAHIHAVLPHIAGRGTPARRAMPMPFQHYRPYVTVDLRDRTWPDVVLQQAPIWCSTDLRDGNQALVNPMDAARKRRFFALLVELRREGDRGRLPGRVEGRLRLRRVLVEEGLILDDTMIAVLTQACPELIERTPTRRSRGQSGRSSTSTNSTSEMRAAWCSTWVRTGSRASRCAARSSARSSPRRLTEIVFQYSPESFQHRAQYGAKICEAVADEWGPRRRPR